MDLLQQTRDSVWFTHRSCVCDFVNWKYGFWGIHLFPAWLCDDGLSDDRNLSTPDTPAGGPRRQPSLSSAAKRYLDHLGLGFEDLFHHVLAVLHSPAYRAANAGALHMDWPRIPLPGWPDGGAAGTTAELAQSAPRGQELAALLDPDMPVSGVTTGALRPEIAAIAIPTTVGGRKVWRSVVSTRA